jgi:hypothetical protein
MRIRVLDLPFTAVEWVVPNEATRTVRPDSWMVRLPGLRSVVVCTS